MGDEAWSKIARTSLGQAQRRVVSRDSLSYQTSIERPRGTQPIEVEIVDLSIWGFQARCGFARFDRGEPVRLNLPLIGLQDAQVRWSLRGCFGAQFHQPVDARAYLDVLAVVAPSRPGH